MEEKTEQKQNKNFLEEHPRAVFWTRFVLWIITGLVLPFLFIALRFNIFKKASSLSLSGWGIIAILLAVAFVLGLIRYLKKGFSVKNVFITQCLNGFTRYIVPLSTLYAILYAGMQNLDAFLQALGCVIICELIAIPVNPMPKWVAECRKDGIKEEGKDVFDYISEKFFDKKEGK